jgi:hypothetical protein
MATNKDFLVKNGLTLGGTITKVNGAAPTNGQLLIGNTTNSNFSVGTLTVSNGVLIVNGAGTISLSTNATSNNTASTIVSRDATGNFSAGTITAALSGNASTATKLQVSRNMSITGDIVPVSNQVDWSTDYVFDLQLTATGVAAGTYNTVTLDTSGRATAAQNANGTVAQKIIGEVAQVSGTSQIAYGNTAPVSTAGTQIWSQAFTPKSATSDIAIEFSGFVDSGTNNRYVTLTCFRGTTLIGLTSAYIASTNSPNAVCLRLMDNPNTTSSVTYSMRIGISTSGNTWYLGKSQGATFGGTNWSGWSITEIY